MKVFSLVLITFFSLFTSFTSNAYEDKNSYYYLNDEKISLPSSYEFFVVSVPWDTSRKTILSDLQNLPSFKNITEEAVEGIEYTANSSYKVLISWEMEDREAYSLAVKELMELEYIDYLGNVMHVNNPNNQSWWKLELAFPIIFVRFKSGTTSNDRKDILESLNLTTYHEDENGIASVEVAESDVTDVLKKANILFESGLVEFAYPYSYGVVIHY